MRAMAEAMEEMVMVTMAHVVAGAKEESNIP